MSLSSAHRSALAGLICLAAACTLAACSGSARLDSADAGRTLVYEPGLPDFDLEAIGTWQDGEPGIDVYLGLPRISLVYVRMQGAYEARYERAIRLFDRESRDLVAEQLDRDTIRVADYEATQSYRPVLQTTRLDVPPGDYVVEVTVTDEVTDKHAVRRQAVALVGPGAGRPHLSRMRLEARRGAAGFEPVVSLHVPSGMDSLRTIVELSHLSPEADVDVSMRLVRFVTDTTVASPPYWLSPSHGALAYRGIEYDARDTLQVSRRRLEDVADAATVEFDLPELSPGVYRIVLRADVPTRSGEVVRLDETRDFSVKPPAFPHLALLEELVEALAYIAFEDEIAHIASAPDAQEMKRRFDAFWGMLVPNRQVAANLVKHYYERVEEANLFFTTYKEGWKTDRGMVYVVLGPPLQVETRADVEVWYYSFGDRDPTSTFVFDRVRTLTREDLFEQYVLQRRSYYQFAWTEAVDRWRDASVL